MINLQVLIISACVVSRVNGMVNTIFYYSSFSIFLINFNFFFQIFGKFFIMFQMYGSL